MEVRKTALPGVLVIEPRVFEDDRGFFLETYQAERYAGLGIDCRFVQDNWSRSQRGTLRGLHYQVGRPQAKLVQVCRGSVFDVAVDLRRNSPHFGLWIGVYLDETNRCQLFIPAGFAHGFYVLSDTADFLYKCSEVYDPEAERTLLWNDPQVGVEWPLEGEPALSDKDRRGTSLEQAECFDSMNATGSPG